MCGMRVWGVVGLGGLHGKEEDFETSFSNVFKFVYLGVGVGMSMLPCVWRSEELAGTCSFLPPHIKLGTSGLTVSTVTL